MAEVGFDCVFHKVRVGTRPKTVPRASQVSFSLDELYREIPKFLNGVPAPKDTSSRSVKRVPVIWTIPERNACHP